MTESDDPKNKFPEPVRTTEQPQTSWSNLLTNNQSKVFQEEVTKKPPQEDYQLTVPQAPLGAVPKDYARQQLASKVQRKEYSFVKNASLVPDSHHQAL